MKRKNDPRHLKRRQIIKELYAFSFTNPHPQSPETKEISKTIPAINQTIGLAAPEWPPSKINKVDLAILQLAIFELKFKKTTPPKVIIDEAVELAKEFGSENSPGFVNGVLGTVIRNSGNKPKL